VAELVEFLTLVVRHWISLVTGSALAAMLFLIDKFTDWKVPRWQIGASLILCVAVSVFQAWQDEHRERVALEAQRPQLQILGIQFDHVLTEMYVDFLVINPGDPTTIANWTLSISTSSRTISGVKQRGLMTERIVKTPLGGIEHDDLVKQPLESGGRRQGRLTYTFTGQDARKEFGRSGTRFDLAAEDVRGLPIRATFTVA
jgi:hypothetical protein